MGDSFSLLGENRVEELDDVALTNILKKVTCDHAMKKLTNHFLKTDCTEIKKIGMEFFFVHEKYKELDELIEENKQILRCSNQEWAEVYNLMLKTVKRNECLLTVANEIYLCKTKDPVVKILKEFIYIYIQLKAKNYEGITTYIEKIRTLMEVVDNKFLIASFENRIDLVMFRYYWTRNEMINTRRIGFNLIKKSIPNHLKVRIHISLGLSYIFETFEQGMYHFKKALRISKKNDYCNHIYMIKNFFIPFYAAHFHRVRGKNNEFKLEENTLLVVKELEKITATLLEKRKKKTPLVYYLLGIVHQNRSYLAKSYHLYAHKCKDYYLSRLPLQALQQLS